MSRQRFLSTKNVIGSYTSFGLLFLRVAISGIMLTHGIGKIMAFSELSQNFNPIGIGGGLSLGLVVFAEVGCSLAIIFGLLTKLATIPLIVAMCVAVFVFHSGDLFAAKEPGLIYLTVYITLFFVGPGRYSVDYALFR